MTPLRELAVGLGGTLVAAVCCFTPVLVVLFGALGLAGAVGYLDFVLLPALAIFALVTIHAIWRVMRK